MTTPTPPRIIDGYRIQAGSLPPGKWHYVLVPEGIDPEDAVVVDSSHPQGSGGNVLAPNPRDCEDALQKAEAKIARLESRGIEDMKFRIAELEAELAEANAVIEKHKVAFAWVHGHTTGGTGFPDVLLGPRYAFRTILGGLHGYTHEELAESAEAALAAAEQEREDG